MIICGLLGTVDDGECVGSGANDGTAFVALGCGVLVEVCVGVTLGDGVCVGAATVGTKVLGMVVGKGTTADSVILIVNAVRV